jgi:PAS domain S-box-containing protein
MIPNLLIVDDIRVNLILLESIVKKIDVNLIKASSGFEALQKSKGIDLALAILDVRMPGMSGYELALKLNEERNDSKVPIIFLTANHIDELEIFEGYDFGAVDFLIKPIDSIILRSKIKVFLDLFNQKQTIIANSASLKVSADKLGKVCAALIRSEEKYRSYIDYAPDGVIVADAKGRFLEVNKAACYITGYSHDKLLKMSFSDIIHGKSLTEAANFFMVLKQQGSAKSDLLFNHKNESIIWCSTESVRIDKNRNLCFIKDISARKQTEKELHSSLKQLKQLARYIEEVREDERVTIARELHDDLGQALTAVKIDLGIIKQDVTDDRLVSKINNVSELVRDTIITVQMLTAQLRPQIIDDLGLQAAIEWYTTDFAQRNQLNVVCHLDPEIISFSPSTSLTIFRIIQESLTNISKYAKASWVEIELIISEDHVEFSISDNGIGINESEIKLKKSFGIIGMKERAASLGGTFEITSGKEKGTVVRIRFPLIKIDTNENSDM